MKQKRIYEQPRTEDLITVGTNIRISRARCLQIMEEVREGTKELRKDNCWYEYPHLPCSLLANYGGSQRRNKRIEEIFLIYQK